MAAVVPQKHVGKNVSNVAASNSADAGTIKTIWPDRLDRGSAIGKGATEQVQKSHHPATKAGRGLG